jgi:hypothetical protein
LDQLNITLLFVSGGKATDTGNNPIWFIFRKNQLHIFFCFNEIEEIPANQSPLEPTISPYYKLILNLKLLIFCLT